MSTLWSTWLLAPRARSAQRQPKALAESSVPTIRSRRHSYSAPGSDCSLDDLLGFYLRECGEQPDDVEVDRRRPEFCRPKGSAQRRPQ